MRPRFALGEFSSLRFSLFLSFLPWHYTDIFSIIHPLWVRTPLTTLLTDTGKTFRQPVLGPEDISHGVVKQIVTQNSGQVIVPKNLSFYSAVRGMPNWAQEAARSWGSKIIKDVRDHHEKVA